ncbi:hypothetical protein COOONC_01414 [Cooperia oncophora]
MTQLRSWLALSNNADREHIYRFLSFIGERYPEKNDLPPLTDLSRAVWQQAIFHKKSDPEYKPDWLSSVLTTHYKVPPATYELMRFVATSWTTPLSLDSSLIPVLLRLHPDDICSPSPSVPNRPCHSARTPSQQPPRSSTDRIFSPRVDLVGLYAERARTLLEKDRPRVLVANEKKIRTLQEKLKKNIKMQQKLQDNVREERSFLESISSSSDRNKTKSLQPALSERASRSSEVSYTDLKKGTEAIDKSLRLLDRTLSKMQVSVGGPVTEQNSSVADSQRTEGVFEDVLETAKEDSSGDDIPDPDYPSLNYYETTVPKEPLPQILKLDLSQLSPQVDIRRQTAAKPPIKSSSQRTTALPEWMRLLPLDETSTSSRLPLLQYNPPKQREWKTERCTQTHGSYSDVTEMACQTVEDERNPPDSGFLDTVDKSSSKRIEIIQPMTKQHIREMLSQM